jgi:hypothetical protein
MNDARDHTTMASDDPIAQAARLRQVLVWAGVICF